MTAKKRRKPKYINLLVVIGLLLSCYLYLMFVKSPTGNINPIKESNDLERTEINYGREVDRVAQNMGYEPSYFKALIVLECSGRKKFKPRFENHVFEKLKKVRDKKKHNYNGITHAMIHDASDDALRNLATSWGPFQLMGYQVIPLDLNIADIRGKDAIYWGMQWIKKRYGKRLKKEQYKDCFHIHNTGRPYPAFGGPRTHDPKYVDKGLKYMTYFQEN